MNTRHRLQIYARTKPVGFNNRQEAELAAYLDASERDTSICAIADADDLKLTVDGVTRRGGHRYTYHSFTQVCQYLASGMSMFIGDVSGMTNRGLPDEQIDGHAAREMFNRMVDLRLGRIEGYRAIRNEKTKRIEGIVGAKHRYLDNRALLAAARDVFNCRDVSFAGALVSGRKLMLWYRRGTPFATPSVGGAAFPLYSGFYLCNGESSGVSVRATMAVFTGHGPCLAPIDEYGGRVTHIGKDFEQRLSRLFATVTEREVPAVELLDGFRRLSRTGLGISDLSAEGRQGRFEELAARLRELGLPKRLAADVVLNAAKQGLDREPVPSWEREFAYRRRTLADLLAALIRTARSLGLRRRERLELAAYTLMIEGR